MGGLHLEVGLGITVGREVVAAVGDAKRLASQEVGELGSHNLAAAANSPPPAMEGLARFRRSAAQPATRRGGGRDEAIRAGCTVLTGPRACRRSAPLESPFMTAAANESPPRDVPDRSCRSVRRRSQSAVTLGTCSPLMSRLALCVYAHSLELTRFK